MEKLYLSRKVQIGPSHEKYMFRAIFLSFGPKVMIILLWAKKISMDWPISSKFVIFGQIYQGNLASKQRKYEKWAKLISETWRQSRGNTRNGPNRPAKLGVKAEEIREMGQTDQQNLASI